jgi:hypothetical protein
MEVQIISGTDVQLFGGPHFVVGWISVTLKSGFPL